MTTTERITEALLRALPAAPTVPLAEPPAEAFDFDGGSCPGCGSADTIRLESCADARCTQCSCEFPTRQKPESRRIIEGINLHRTRRFNRFERAFGPL